MTLEPETEVSYVNSYVEGLERKLASATATATAESLANGTPPAATSRSTGSVAPTAQANTEELDHSLGTSCRSDSRPEHCDMASLLSSSDRPRANHVFKPQLRVPYQKPTL